ncbi:hypothetical protein [Baaleninema simplex]|uniref:hypothetical protein n=1 Tax=Baaleninema simplex TaxID=2862350 RepID=UPI0003484394|nr:hypothetical protein [Baaleninema simplex]
MQSNYTTIPTDPPNEKERSNILKDESIQDILAEIHAQRPETRSVEEIDRDLQTERDAWDS